MNIDKQCRNKERIRKTTHIRVSLDVFGELRVVTVELAAVTRDCVILSVIVNQNKKTISCKEFDDEKEAQVGGRLLQIRIAGARGGPACIQEPPRSAWTKSHTWVLLLGCAASMWQCSGHALTLITWQQCTRWLSGQRHCWVAACNMHDWLLSAARIAFRWQAQTHSWKKHP